MMAFWRFWRFEEDLTLSLSWIQIKGHPVNTEFLLPPSVSVLTGFDRTYQALNQTLQTTNINYEKLLGYQVVKNTQFQSVFFFKFVHPCLRLFCRVINYFFKYTVFSDSLYQIPLITDVIQLTLILKMTTAQAVELSVSHCQQQQFYSGLRSPGGSSESSYLWFFLCFTKFWYVVIIL